MNKNEQSTSSKNFEAYVDAFNDATSKLEELIENCTSGVEIPKILYHFTDTDGLLGILKERSLHASNATTLGDASELRYTTNSLEALIKNSAPLVGGLSIEELLKLVAKVATASWQSEQIYLSSFCDTHDKALHWLHYGRSGTGVAIGFATQCLLQHPHSILSPVIYDLEKQNELLSKIVREMSSFADSEATRAAFGDKPVEDVAATMMAYFARTLAPRIKAPVFEPEGEWRIIGSDTFTQRNTWPTDFKSRFGRIVPFKRIDFDPRCITEIVLGYSSPLHDNDALRVLMNDKLETLVPVTRSTVPVRP